jgi:hypothetical protein
MNNRKIRNGTPAELNELCLEDLIRTATSGLLSDTNPVGINSSGLRETYSEFGIIYFAYKTSSQKINWYRIDLICCAIVLNYYINSYGQDHPRTELIDILYQSGCIYTPAEPNKDDQFLSVYVRNQLKKFMKQDLWDPSNATLGAFNDEVSSLAARYLYDAKYAIFQTDKNWVLHNKHKYQSDPGYLMAMVGLSASGKTTLAIKLFPDNFFVIMDEPNTKDDIDQAYQVLHPNFGARSLTIQRVANMSDGLVLSLILSLVTPGCTLDSVSLMSRKGVEAAKAHLTNEFPQWLAALSSFLRQSGGKMTYLWNEYAADDSLRDEIRARTMASTTAYIIIHDFGSAEISSRVVLKLGALEHPGNRMINRFNPGNIIQGQSSSQATSVSFRPTKYANEETWNNPISKFSLAPTEGQKLVDDTTNLSDGKHQLAVDQINDLSKIFSV